MIVCSCNVLSEADVRSALAQADLRPRSAGEVYGCLGCSPKCGRCAHTIQKLMNEGCGGGAYACCVSSQDPGERGDAASSHETIDAAWS